MLWRTRRAFGCSGQNAAYNELSCVAAGHALPTIVEFRFDSDPDVKLAVCNIIAGGVAITLTTPWDAAGASNWTGHLLGAHGVQPGVTIRVVPTGGQPNSVYPHLMENTRVDVARIGRRVSALLYCGCLSQNKNV